MSQNKNENNNFIPTLNDINAIILVANKKGEIIFVNKATTEILGYESNELLGDGWWKLTKSNLDAEKRKSNTIALAKGEIDIKNTHLFENALIAKNGNIVWTQWTNTINSQGHLVGIAQDITQKKVLQQKLIQKNKENELLLKEVHHRVKNNLQIISSMLNLQFNHINDVRVFEALQKSKDRIHSMALIHEKIYTSKNLAAINFDDYILDLSKAIKHSYDSNKEIELTINKSGAIFNIDLAVNLGLIITELLTNSYKHAFLASNTGKIIIELKIISGNKYSLIVQDNGKGIIQKDLTNIKTSFGLEIVHALTDQINGTLKTESKNGLKHSLQFEL